jgi:hypothetical protein
MAQFLRPVLPRSGAVTTCSKNRLYDWQYSIAIAAAQAEADGGFYLRAMMVLKTSTKLWTIAPATPNRRSALESVRIEPGKPPP